MENKRINKTKYCAATLCDNNRRKNPDLSFFKFPKNERRCSQWLKAAGREEVMHKKLNDFASYSNQNLILCANHFEMHMFRDGRLNRLGSDASPTMFGEGFYVDNFKQDDGATTDRIQSEMLPKVASEVGEDVLEDSEDHETATISEELDQTLTALTEARKETRNLSKEIAAVSENIAKLQRENGCAVKIHEFTPAELCRLLPNYLPKDYAIRAVGLVEALQNFRNYF